MAYPKIEKPKPVGSTGKSDIAPVEDGWPGSEKKNETKEGGKK